MDEVFIVGYLEKSLNFTIFDTKWIPKSAKFVVVGNRPNGKGVLKVFELNVGEIDPIAEVEYENRVKCGSFGASSLRKQHFAVGTFDGHLRICDMAVSNPSIYEVDAHENAITNCIDAIGGGLLVNCGPPEIATGGSDGYVKLWDIRQKDPVACMAPTKPHQSATSRECWAVAFGNSFDNDNRALCAGYDNGDIKMFDLRQMKVCFEKNVKNGICDIQFDRRDILMNKMAVATLEGGLGVYDLRTQHSKKGFANVWENDAGRALGSRGIIEGMKSTVWCVRHLPQNREIFATCGGSGTVRLWKYEYPEHRKREMADGEVQGIAGSLKLLHATCVSTQPVNCFDWHQDRTGLAVCSSFDQTARVLLATNLHLL